MTKTLLSLVVAISAFGAFSAAAPAAASCPILKPINQQPGIKPYQGSNAKSSRDLETRSPPSEFPDHGLVLLPDLLDVTRWMVPDNTGWYFRPGEKFGMDLAGDTGLIFIDHCATYGINIPPSQVTGTPEWINVLQSFMKDYGLTTQAKVLLVSPNTITPGQGIHYDRVAFRTDIATRLHNLGFRFFNTEYCSIPNGPGTARINVDAAGNAACQQTS